MIPKEISIVGGLNIKDSLGRKKTVCGVHDNSLYFNVGLDYMREDEIRRRYFLWTEEDEKKAHPEGYVVYPRQSAWHCILCGEEMWHEAKSERKTYWLHCRKCDATYHVHHPKDENRPAGDSFSLTYWH